MAQRTTTRGFCTAGIHFDTYRFAQNLRGKGFTPKEAEVILAATRNAIQEMNTSRASLYIPKADHLELKTDLSQRVLRSTMNFDVAHRHMREVLERDFSNLKNDIRMTEKLDFDKVRFELLKVEKEFLLQKKTDEETLNTLHIANERLEKRILQFVVGFSGSMMLVLARLGAFF
ncbi:hypothetical protein SDRG_03826 [Saprolegnia diclina VS20]|uniref:DUF1640 domain-containing protein n=1 Tax=Saprolegnia diclina (strain VS20) TaxID=1156394 RepID=T0S1G9_SAPDV|nr:hypothetical protein SDRG_03826 [Saprolegnia diclina VS20]EQC38868.1 hypothetical protein SDRG_03826 [Saprolegnia diclina VS20]|eukprot:XP_008607692.1 hypothetical protein SDRG_03826 [Saprolegnia diclina VS20]